MPTRLSAQQEPVDESSMVPSVLARTQYSEINSLFLVPFTYRELVLVVLGVANYSL